MYVVDLNPDVVSEYNLSTAWDVSTASYLQNFSVLAEEPSASVLFFRGDGLKMYVMGTSGDDVNEYNLSTAWDVSTASYLQNFFVGSQDNAPQGLFFKPDGLKMYVSGSSGDSIYTYTLTTAWDISTATWDAPTRNYLSADAATGLFFKPDGSKMYVISNLVSDDSVHEYDLGSAWDISTASYLQNFSVADREIFPLGLFFRPDGLKMYVIGTDGDDINEYTLSSAWDISSATYTQNFSVSSQESAPNAVFFRDDGIKMYVVGSSGDDVNEYDLSSAWDVSTASYVQNFSVSAQDTFPSGLFFKPDGSKMFVSGLVQDTVSEYDLGTEWDVSTAVYAKNFSLNPPKAIPRGLFFKPDGTKMYSADSGTQSIWSYDL
jgi:DNA-binding beta-propeller fold protein YncE